MTSQSNHQHKREYQAQELSEAERERFRKIASESARAKRMAQEGVGPPPIHEINEPILDPCDLMPMSYPHGLRALSLFSGGGGLDLAYERAGFEHTGSFEWLTEAGQTLLSARPSWRVWSGELGDVRQVDWSDYQDIDVVHGGPPCQPFSNAGRQRGPQDPRDMVPEFTRAVLETQPRAFQMENVAALAQSKFSRYLEETVLKPLSTDFEITTFFLHAGDFGVPQSRKRFFIVGLHKAITAKFEIPCATHSWDHLKTKARSPQLGLPFTSADEELPRTMGAREALGLPSIGIDRLAPTLRSTLNGPRGTTSILSSTSARSVWEEIEIWPNGVARDRIAARNFVAKNGHFRLSLADCALLQGFPDDWPFQGATYVALGQIGNAVPPPLGFHVAKSLAASLLG